MINNICPETFVKNMNDFFIKFNDTKKLNKLNSKLRNSKDGITNTRAMIYKFLYTKLNITKDKCVSNINEKYNTSYLRNAYESKENNISVTVYHHMYDQIKQLYHSLFPGANTDCKLIAIDGTCNTNKNMDVMLNMGYFDPDNGIPLDLTFNGNKNRNKEIKCSTDYIKNNLSSFENKILVFDRGYFSFEFISFLITNKLKFIIRKKGNTNNVYDKFKSQIRKIFIDHTYTKTVYKSKKSRIKKDITLNNSYEFTTNLDEKYSPKKIFELYGKRWDVEVFFKFIKYNFKFQNLAEKSTNSCKKLYFCELILFYLKELIKRFYIQNRNIKINNSLLMENIYDYLLFEILSGTLTIQKLNKFCKIHITKIKNKENRSNPRISKTPFSKWYVKGFSEYAKFIKILEAIKKGTVDKLHKNLKLIAHKIIEINKNHRTEKKEVE